jgi:hypothetical protein
MSIQPPQGILTIPNATLRVGRLQVDEVEGFDTVLNTFDKNTILEEDSEVYDVDKKWGVKMPNIFVATFEIKGVGSSFNFRNTSTGDAGVGYTLTFSGTTLTLKYDDTQLGDLATIPNLNSTYGKVYLTYEKQYFTVTVDGTRVLSYKDTGTRTFPDGEYINFFAGTGSRGFKNLKVVAGHLISDGTSNVSLFGGLAVTSNLEVGSSNLFVDTVNSRVGVGTDTPKESLDVVGNMHLTRVSNVSQIKVDSNVVTEYTGPHDRPLREYPEVALTADAETASGYKGYKVSASSNVTDKNPWEAFNPSDYWRSLNEYSTSDPYGYTGVEDITDTNGTLHEGEWLKLELPNKINISRVTFLFHSSGSFQPTSYVILGSNNDTSWTLIHTNENLSPGLLPSYTTEDNFTTVGYFKYLKLLVKNVIDATPSVIITRLRYYGYEEGSGSLDTTLKSVYNVPATTGTQLEVYYDAKDLADGAVTSIEDLSPKSNDGSVAGNPQVSNGAFVFDGVDDSISATSIGNSVGDWTHSSSFWFKFAVVEDGSFYSIGPNTVSGQNVTSLYYDASGYIQTSVSGGVYTRCGNVFLLPNNWYHITTVKRTNAQDSIYLNGNELPVTVYANTELQMSLPANTSLNIGTRPDQSSFFNGSIANFRLYSKALNADQVKELYDYQKDYFLGSKSQVTLYKGHLGVGVTEPSGQLELAGDERIQEYPPRGMTHSDGTAPDAQVGGKSKNITYIEGHGEFKASASKWSTGTSGYDGQQPYNAFDKTTTRGWLSYDNLGYNNTTGAYEDNEYILSASSGTPYGHWLKLEMPYTINIKSYFLDGSSRNYSPHDWQIWASNDDNSWTHIHSYSGETYDDSNGRYYTVSHAGHYKMFAIIVTSIHPGATHNGSPTDRIWIREMKYFGTPGPTTLDKGSLSLGRSLDVPRVSRYDVDTETPRPEKLVLDFDTTVNSSPTDISGQGNHGRFVGTAQYSPADKAFVFDGNSDYIQGTLNLNGSELNTSYTLSMWVKSDSTANDTAVFMFIGSSVSGDAIGFRHNNNISSGGTEYRLYHFGVTDTSATSQPTNLNQWRHLVAMYDGTNHKIFVDGVLAVTGAASDLNTIPNSPTYSIGYRWNGGSADEYFDGMVSNPKLYSVALEPSEVRKLYNLGRTGRSMVISDTAVGIGKVPEAQLDVRGVANFGSRVGIGKTGAGYPLDVVGEIYASGDIIAFSDERKKTDIEPIPNALEKVLQLRGVTFNKLDDDNRRHAGVIAQEVEKVLPEVVYTSEDGTKSVAYGNLVGLLIEAIKELAGK